MGPRPRPIVVGYDGSPDADLALEWTVRTAALAGNPVQVVVVGTHMDPVVGHFRENDDHLTEAWQGRAHDLLEQAGVGSWEVELRRGPTVPVLLGAAGDAEMLVVGSSGHGLLLGSLSGSVSQHVARHASCPVVVVRPLRQPSARQIAVGLDGSESSAAALRFALDRAERTGERVVAVHGYRAPGLPAGADRLVARVVDRMDAENTRLAEFAESAAADHPGVALTTLAMPATPERLLLDSSMVASLLVVGSRGRDAFAELLLGSVAQHLLRSAHCPVAVVR